MKFYLYILLIISLFFLKQSSGEITISFWNSVVGIDDGNAENANNWLPSIVPTINSYVVSVGDDLTPLTINKSFRVYNMSIYDSEVYCKSNISVTTDIDSENNFYLYNDLKAENFFNTYMLHIEGPSIFNSTMYNDGIVYLNSGVIFDKYFVNKFFLVNNVIAHLQFNGIFATMEGGESMFIQYENVWFYGGFLIQNSDSIVDVEDVDKFALYGIFIQRDFASLKLSGSNMYFTEISQISDGSTISSLDSTLFFYKEGLDFTQGLRVFNDLNTYTNITLDNSRMIFVQYAFWSQKNSRVFMKNSTIQCDHSYLLMTDNSYIEAKDGSAFFIDEGSAILLQDSHIYISNASAMTIQGSEMSGFSSNNDSKIEILQKSVFSIKGPLLIRDSSSVLVGNSSCVIDGVIKCDGQSKMLFDDHSLLYLDGSLLTVSSSYVRINQTLLAITGILSVVENSKFESIDSLITIFTGGDIFLGDSSTTSLINTQLINTGYLINNSTLTIVSSTVDIGGSLFSNGFKNATDSSIIVSGNILITGTFIGSRLNITVLNGDFFVKGSSNFSCNGCDISILSGTFITDSNANVYLEGTTIKNGGTMTSNGQLTLYPGSSISNDGQFILSSDIISDNNQLLLNNQGTFTFKYDSKVQVPISSNGEMNIGNQQVDIIKFNQTTGGNFILDNGSIKSNSSIDFIGGSVIGSGTFNGNVVNSAQFGNSKINKVDKISINGDYQHGPDGSIIFVVENENDFSNLFILNNINVMGGQIEIRISLQFLNEIKEKSINSTIDLISFGSNSNNNLNYNNLENSNGSSNNNSSSFGFDKIVFKTFDGQDSTPKEITNECVSTRSSGSKFSLLLVSSCSVDGEGSENGNEKESLTSKAWIAGPILGCVAIAIIAVAIYVKRERLSIFMKLKKDSISSKLKTFKK